MLLIIITQKNVQKNILLLSSPPEYVTVLMQPKKPYEQDVLRDKQSSPPSLEHL